jgi:hypothetical protein
MLAPPFRASAFTFSPVFRIFSYFFSVRLKQNSGETHIYSMRPKRILAQDAWYEVRTAINNREPLFRRRQAITIFCRVFGETRKRFDFKLRGFRLDEEWLSFYIKPASGLRLPAIMQWMKQTFAVRFNRRGGRSGHVWGDRYWSRVVEGKPPDGVSPLTTGNPTEPGFSPQTPAPPPSPG